LIGFVQGLVRVDVPFLQEKARVGEGPQQIDIACSLRVVGNGGALSAGLLSNLAPQHWINGRYGSCPSTRGQEIESATFTRQFPGRACKGGSGDDKNY
jgi:hypothetical protein